MSALVIDTSSWVSYFAGHGSPLIDDALAEGRVFLPAVVAAELLSGRLSAPDRSALEDLLSDLPLCGTEHQHWFRVGKLRASLLPKGVSVSTPDAHVAQCALDLQATLLTEDRIFGLMSKHVPLALA